MKVVLSSNLVKAIQYRRWCRVALSKEDWSEVARLNKIADQAYLKLNNEEAKAYLKWKLSQ